MKDLKPCPFCGGDAGNSEATGFIWCKKYGINILTDTKKWNTRAERECFCGMSCPVAGSYCCECGGKIKEVTQ